MGWEHFAPTVMGTLEGFDKDKMRDAQIQHLGAQNEHLAAQNRHMVESDRLLGSWHDMQAQLKEEQLANQRLQIEAMERVKVGQLGIAKNRFISNFTKSIVDPWKEVLRTHSAEYNHFAQRYMQELQSAVTDKATAIAESNADAAQLAEDRLAHVVETMRNDPMLQKFAQQADQLAASKGHQQRGFQEEMMLRMAPGFAAGYAQNINRIPLMPGTPGTEGLNIGPGVADQFLQMMKLFQQGLGPGAGAPPGVAPGGMGQMSPPTAPAPGAAMPPQIPRTGMPAFQPPNQSYMNALPFMNPEAVGRIPQGNSGLNVPSYNIGVAPLPPPRASLLPQAPANPYEEDPDMRYDVYQNLFQSMYPQRR